MTQLRPVLCLVGPTASGKSAAAYALARRWGTEIIMADSRQLYQGMEIGTDQPPTPWREEVAHHLVGVLPPDAPFNAGLFCRAAEPILDRLHAAGKIPIVVGGTGLYVRALLYGLTSSPPADAALRRRLSEQSEEEGASSLHAWLQSVDPASAAVIAPADRPKLIRALEVYLLTGRPRSAWHDEHGCRSARYAHALIGLRLPRPLLYRRIDERVEQMVRRGLVEEARTLWRAGYDERHSAMRGLGYRQLVRAFCGDGSVDDAIRETATQTKRYAKRQLTWFRRQPGLRWIDLAGTESAVDVAEAVHRAAGHQWANVDRCAIMAPLFFDDHHAESTA
jgi:tRNA dimethylallyltransferase